MGNFELVKLNFKAKYFRAVRALNRRKRLLKSIIRAAAVPIILILIIAMLFFFNSCEKTSEQGNCLAYQNSAFDAIVCVEYPSISFTAQVNAGEWSAGNGENSTVSFSSRGTIGASEPNILTVADGSVKDVGKRDATVTILSPESLAGIKVTRICGNVTAELDGIVYESSALSGILDFLELFQITGEPLGIDVNGNYNTVKIHRAAVAGETDEENYEIILDSSKGTPTGIKGNPDGRSISVGIESFEINVAQGSGY